LIKKNWRKKMKKLLTLVTALTLVFAVAGCGGNDDPVGPTDADLVAEATTALLLTDLNEVTDDLELPTGGLHSSVITWASSDEAVITGAGEVTRPAVGADNAVVTMTATITIGDESDTKEFTVRVIAAVPTLDVTIAVFNSDTVSVDDDIVVTGIVFGIVEGAGFQISDGTAFVFVYAGTSEGVALGDNVAVTGQKTIYYGLPEVDTVTSTEVLSSGNTLPTYEVTSIVDLFDEDPFDTAYWSKPITITGLVSVDGDGNAVLTATSAEGMAYNVVVYYKSFPAQITALVALEGKMATAEVIVYGYHDGLGAWRVTVTEGAVLSSTDPSDAEMALWEAGQLDLGELNEVTADLTLNTVGELVGTTIAWASDTEAVISTAGVVTRTSGADVTVTLTATITVGAETADKVFVVTVKDLDFALVTLTVAEAIATDAEVIPDGTLSPEPIVVQGIVTAIIGSSKIVLQDATGGPGITTYTSGFNNDNTFALGDEIIIRGTHVIYYGLEELSNISLVSVVSSGNTVQLSTTMTVADIIADLAAAPYALQGLNAVLTNLEVIDVDYDAKTGYVVVGDGSGNNIIFSAYDISYSDTFEVGDIITELTVIVWDYYYSATRVIVTAYPGLSDAEALAAAEAALDIPLTTEVDLVLPLLDDDYDVVISWASNLPLVLSDAGVVVQPLLGEADVDVELTATFTKGTETPVVVVYTVTVTAIQPVGDADPLFFSEIIEGSSNNKAIEIYNPTDAEVDLSLYSVRENYGSGDNTLALSGMLAAGEVYVICTDQAGTEITAECDLALSYPSISHFNGDDSLQLLFNTTVIDQFIAEADAGTGDAAKDIYGEHTFVRLATVVEGVTVFNMTEWTTYDQDDFTHIGSHTTD